MNDQNNHSVGRLEGLLVDLTTGYVLAAQLAAGNDQVVLLPATAFSLVADTKILLDVEKTAVESAPRHPKSGMPDSCSLDKLEASCRHFRMSSQDLTAVGSRKLRLATSIIGLNLVDKSKAPLGRIREVMVDLPRGRMVYLVVEPAGGLTAPGELYVIPPSVVRAEADGRTLRLEADRAHFAAGPRFSSSFWSDLAFPELSERVSRHYSLSVAVAGPSRCQQAAATTPADAALNQAVVEALVRLQKSSARMNIAVTTMGGRVTLAGIVNGESQKREILATARRIAGDSNVEDRLETKRKGKTSEL